jgi:heat-inducible transcriptional repressor
VAGSHPKKAGRNETRMSDPALQERERDVLRAVVDSYIETGEPVGSRTLSRGNPEGGSAATIRNVMSDLEEVGLLTHPHTSAGRVPTERGLRYYVERLLEPRTIPEEEKDRIRDALRSHRGEVSALLESASHVLADMSHNVGMVLVPDFSQRVFEKIDFVAIGPRRIVALFVSRPGLVDHRVLEVEEDYPQEELDRISRYLSDSFRGLSLSRIRAKLLDMMSEEKSQYDRLMREAIDLSARSFDATGTRSDLIVEGTTNILDPRVFPDVDTMKRLFQSFEEKSRLVALLNRCLHGKGHRLFIGSEAEGALMDGCALVVAPYHDGSRPVGTVGILGPTHMEYARAISLVETLSRLLTDLLMEPGRGSEPAVKGGPGA